MPRTHVIQSWVGAAEYEEGDTYSGEQIGNRNQRSIGVAFERSGDGWSARKLPDVWTKDGKPNIKAFSDEALGLNGKKTPAKKSVPIAHKIVPQERTLERLDQQEKALYAEFEEGEMSDEEFQRLIYALEKKRHRAWKARCRALGVDPEEPEDYIQEKDEYIEEEYPQESIQKGDLVGFLGAEKRVCWGNENVFIWLYNQAKQCNFSVVKKKKIDKEKLSPYVGGVVLSFITFLILF